jgi:hypothetical protein
MSFKEDLEEVITDLDYAVNRAKLFNENVSTHLSVYKLEQLINILRYTNLESDELFNPGYDMGYTDGQKENLK